MGLNKHRSGVLKQKNKTHKTGRHRSKASTNKILKGKTNVKISNRSAIKELSKEIRRNQSQQLRKKKQNELVADKRDFQSFSSPPILITILTLNKDMDVSSIVSMIAGVDDAIVIPNNNGIINVSIPRLNQRLAIIVPPTNNLFAILDAVKISTVVLFVISAANIPKSPTNNQIIDSWGEEILETCISQGLPNTAAILTNTENINIKKLHEIKQIFQNAITKRLPTEKVSILNNSTDALNLLRRLGSQKQPSFLHGIKRPFLLAEDMQYCHSIGDTGTLKVSGYLRMAPLSVNGIVHIPGFGDFHLSQIDILKDPSLTSSSSKLKDRNVSNPMNDEPRILEQSDPSKQESLESENVPDAMDTEQTWPTDDDILQAKKSQQKEFKLVPKGTSVYQASWIIDENGESDEESHDDDDAKSDEVMSVAQTQSDIDDDYEEYMNEKNKFEVLVSETAVDHKRYDEQMDIFEEKEMKKRIQDAKLDSKFPDEVDTPEDIPAMIRFQKYRGLESFKTSLWNPKENLPYDYSRIFQFENFDRTRKRILKESKKAEGAMPGWYITLYIKDFSIHHYKILETSEHVPFIVVGLLPNEHKMSLLNITLNRKRDVDAIPIKSKDKLIFQCGFRRFSACPIFSDHTLGNKHKYARYFQENDTLVASMYAPITFPPCRVLCYREHQNGILKLVATGNVLSADTNRLVIKRVVLSGYPYKIFKKTAVVRFMFSNRDDILWFKSVQLHTKYGRRGHILEPLGTHGHMKCIFDGQLKSQDTILMNLYKRVFPKWTYEPYLLSNK